MIAQGTYRGKAVTGALGVTSKGTEQVAIQFELLDHPGQHIVWYGYFTEKTMGGTIKALRTCGWVGDDLSDLGGITDNEVTLVIEHETDDRGVVRAKVRWVNGNGGLAMKDAMKPEQAKAFAALMRGQVIAASGGKPSTGKAAAKPRSAPNGGKEQEQADDDIPF